MKFQNDCFSKAPCKMIVSKLQYGLLSEILQINADRRNRFAKRNSCSYQYIKILSVCYLFAVENEQLDNSWKSEHDCEIGLKIYLDICLMLMLEKNHTVFNWSI